VAGLSAITKLGWYEEIFEYFSMISMITGDMSRIENFIGQKE